MANLNVTYEQMQAAATRLRSGQQDVESRLQELRVMVSDLVANGFTTSAASSAFSASYEQFTSGATQTVGGIEGMARFLDLAAQALSDTDAQLASQLGG